MKKKLMALAAAILSVITAVSATACGGGNRPTASTGGDPTTSTSAGNTDSSGGGSSGEAVVPAQFRQEPDYSPRNGQKREWNKVSSYFCNYGSFKEEMLDYDVGIISGNIGPNGLQKLKDAGVWTIRYISFGEDNPLRTGDGLGPGGFASYYLYDDEDKPIPNGDWGSYYTDPGSPAWREFLFEDIQSVVDDGYDGIFIDTVDSVDRFPETFNDMCDLIMTVHEKWPDLKLVLNRGFTVVPTVYEALDGVMFELFSTAYDLTTFEYDMLDESSAQFSYNRQWGVSIVNAVRQKKYFPVFGLEYYPIDGAQVVKQAIYDLDWEFDFIPYLTMNGRILDGPMAPFDLRPQSERGVRALSLRDPIEGVDINGDTSSSNLIYSSNGGTVEVDSSFTGYSASALNDGYIANADNFYLIGFQWANWASAETVLDHWAQMTVSNPVQATKLVIDWAWDNGLVYSSKEVHVEALIDGEWVRVGEISDIPEETVRSEITLTTPSPTNTYRVVQTAGDGPTARPNLMWISELSLYAD